MEYKSIEEIQAEIEEQMMHIKEPIFTFKDPPDPDCYLNAYLDVEWDVYAEGYKKGADILVKYIISNNQDQDLLVYPIVFLYRQYLELRLKELIHVSLELLDETIDLPKHHDLDLLSRRTRLYIEKVWSESQKKGSISEVENKLERKCSKDLSLYSNTRDNLEQIGSRLKEICSIDQGSYAFRYPEDKEGVSNLAGMSYINLKRVSDVVKGMSNVLDNICRIIDKDLGAKY